MDNFNNGNNEMPEEKSGFKLAQEETPIAPQFGQPMGGAPQQPQFGQPMGGMPQQPQFGQPMGGMNQQPQFGQPQMGGMPQQPQFGQPQMGMVNQQPYGQPPMGGGKPPKVKKPLSKGAIGGIIGGGIALIALIVCAIIFLPKLFKTDKEVVLDAFEATFGIEADATTEDIVGAQEIADKFATTGGVREFSMEIVENTTGEELTVGAGFSETIDVQNKLANSDWTISMNGADFLNASMVVDETNTYFQVPELINGYFSLPNENIFQALENSELGQAMQLEGMPEFNMADMYFNLATSTAATEINSEYVTILEELWDSVTYEKQGKAKIDVNGKTVTAKEYYITVPQKSMKKAITDMWDVVVAEAAANPAALAELGMDTDTFQSTMSSYSGIFTSLIQNDLVVKVYVKGDKIVKIVCGDELSLYGANIGYDFSLDIDDENASGALNFDVMGETAGVKFNAENIDTAPSGKVTVFASGEVIDVNFKTTDNSSDSKDSYDVYCDVVYNGTTYVTVDMKTNMDKNTNAFDGNMSIDIKDAGVIKAEFAGGLKDVKKGVAYTVELSKCDLYADDEKMVGMAAKIKVDTSTHDAKGIDTSLPVYDVTTLTEATFQDILTDNEALINEWLDSNSDIFGSTVVEPTEPAEPTEPDEPAEDDMILEAELVDKKVEILGCIDGFALDYVSDWYISYATEEYSYVEYSLYEDWTPGEVAEFIYVPEEDVLAQEIGQTIEVDGETVYYSYVQYKSFDMTFSSYMFAKEIGDGVVLCSSIGIYDDDEPVTYTKEMLAETISTKYYKVLN